MSRTFNAVITVRPDGEAFDEAEIYAMTGQRVDIMMSARSFTGAVEQAGIDHDGHAHLLVSGVIE